VYSLRSFISIILAFGVVTKEQNKTTQFAFNHRVLSTYEESQPMSSKEKINGMSNKRTINADKFQANMKEIFE
jgi:hypothetical protein